MTDFTIRDAIMKLADRRDLTVAEAAACMEELMSGTATPSQFGAFVTALRLKGETVDEITGMATVMREKASRIDVEGPLLDTCGTGGDESGSFNVSTCAAFIAAGAGARVAKHGNRAMTSRCGSADVLEALGAKIDLTREQVGACIEKVGVGFMFAQAFHPAMKFVAPLRREIGIRTVFNILGPLTNPAGATHQVIGVPRADLVEKLAAVLLRLGADHALVVHGEDGFDEISVAGPSLVGEVIDGAVRTYTVTPEDAGIARHDISAILGDTPEHNAAELRGVLDGRKGALRDFALLNAGAALVAWGTASDLRAGVGLAAESIDSGCGEGEARGVCRCNERLRMTDIIDQIVADKRVEVEQRKLQEPLDALKRRQDLLRTDQWSMVRSILEGPRGPSSGGRRIQLVAEVKKATPSKGPLVATLEHRTLARGFTNGGAAAISILTESKYFQGSIDFVSDIRASLDGSYPGGRPALLRKDFIFDPYQVHESRAYGADAMLIIVSIVTDDELVQLNDLAHKLGLETLVEVASDEEVERALKIDGDMIGINNRDLRTFEVDLAQTERLRPLIPMDRVVIALSGVHTRADVERMAKAQVHAVLVGESLMTAPDVPTKMRELLI